LTTEGLSVDEAFTLFEDGFGVTKSKKMRREKMEMKKTYRKASVTEPSSGTSAVESKGTMVHVEKA
jgi:SP family myo-inositol transporter-like MFS transporter 13